jgi:hypothetical protein
MGERSGKTMRLLIVVLAGVLWLYACTQPPVENEDDLFECDFSKDGKFLVCHERKRTETAAK